jgi:hypothetical protein
MCAEHRASGNHLLSTCFPSLTRALQILQHANAALLQELGGHQLPAAKMGPGSNLEFSFFFFFLFPRSLMAVCLVHKQFGFTHERQPGVGEAIACVKWLHVYGKRMTLLSKRGKVWPSI